MAGPRKRKPAKAQTPVASEEPEPPSENISAMDWIRRQPLWIVLAVSSGACAAINGVFAKLTTTAVTSDFAAALARFFNVAEDDTYVNLGLRSSFFGLNIVFNIAMWALFTAALRKGSSATRVSIVNVSSNFLLTAVLGAMIFAEKLPGLWFLGAACLVAGNAIIGRRDEGEEKVHNDAQEARTSNDSVQDLLLSDDDDVLELPESFESQQDRALLRS